MESALPSRSKSQQRLMQAAEHGATFPLAKHLRASMSHEQLHDFAVGSEQGKPEHVKGDTRHARHLRSMMHQQTRKRS